MNRDLVSKEWLDANFKKVGEYWMSSTSDRHVWVRWVDGDDSWSAGISFSKSSSVTLFNGFPMSLTHLGRMVNVVHMSSGMPSSPMRDAIEAWGVNIPMLQMSLMQLRAAQDDKARRTPPCDFNPADDLYRKNLARFIDALAGAADFPRDVNVTGFSDDHLSLAQDRTA